MYTYYSCLFHDIPHVWNPHCGGPQAPRAVSKHIQNVLLIWRTDCAAGTHYRAPFTPLAVDSSTEFSAHECYLLLHLRDTDPSLPPPAADESASASASASASSSSASSSASSAGSSSSASSSSAASAASSATATPSWMLVDESVLHLLTSLAATIEPKDLVTPVNPRALVLVLPRARRSLRYASCGFRAKMIITRPISIDL
jgi:hypothetical protein